MTQHTNDANSTSTEREVSVPEAGESPQELTTSERITLLDRDITRAMMNIQPRQRQFAYGISEGKTPGEACVSAGYSKNNAGSQGRNLLQNPLVSYAITLLSTKYQLMHGISAGVKRSILLHIAENQKDLAPSASTGAISELNKMDGGHAATKHVHEHDAKVQISYVLEMPERENGKPVNIIDAE